MNNNQSTRNLRRRVAVLLVVSILNFVVSPLFPRNSTKAVAAPLKPVDGPTSFIRRLPLVTNDLVYSSTTGKIYASVPSSVGTGGNSIAAIDPTTGLVASSTFIGSEPTKLALSDDGHSLYVWLDGAAAIRRFDAQTDTPGLQFSMGEDPTSDRYTVGDFAVAPANPNVLAVARALSNGDAAGVAVFDDGVPRPAVGANIASGPRSLAFSATASTLYGSAQFVSLTMTIVPAGVAVSSGSALGANASIQFNNGFIFTSLGQVYNPDTNAVRGTFAEVNTSSFVVDTAVGRAYYLTSGPSAGSYLLKAFDINTFALLGSLTINDVEGTPTPLLRWGANGLAFRSNNELFLIQTSLIPSAEPIPDRTPGSLPSPSPSPSPVPTFVRPMKLNSNDLVFSQATQKLYASVASLDDTNGNSIAEIDPVSGSITNQTFVGSEPKQLALADDGATLYVGLEGSASIRSYNILTHTPGAQFKLGRDNSEGPYSLSDIAVSPGNPSIIAVARIRNLISPAQRGVAIFENGVQRSNTGPTDSEGSRFISFASSSVLHGNNDHQGLTTMSVDDSGVTATGTTRFQAGSSMILANGLLYGASGQVINPTTGNLVGTFSGVSTAVTIHAVDLANDRVFFLVPAISGSQLRAFDINTFLPLGVVNVSGTNYYSDHLSDLVRWGKHGLAFRINRQVILVETALVNARTDLPDPTPTPSPTPSPSASPIPTFVRQVHLPANNLVFSEASQSLYASVPGNAGANGNSITKINPQTGAVGPSVFIGNEPNRMAISDDGKTIWAHLDRAGAVRRFDVLSETPGLQFATGLVPPGDMEVVPGSPQSVALSMEQSGGGIVIYDNGVPRPNIGNTTPAVGPIEFGADPSVLYGYNRFTDSFDLVKFLVDSSGVTVSSVTQNLFAGGGNVLKFSNGLLYTGSGLAVDPENKTWVGRFNSQYIEAMAVDAANRRVFFAAYTGSFSRGIIISAFDTNTFLPLGAINVPGINNLPINLLRWGENGLAFNTAPQFSPEMRRVYLVQSRLVSDAGTIPSGLALEQDHFSVSEGHSTLQVMVSRTGDESTPVSVNYATSDGTATAGSDYTATSGTLNFAPGELTKSVSIPISDDRLFENGNETFKVTLSSPTNSALLLTPGSATVTILDNDSKPVVTFPSRPELMHTSIVEGDSGTKNLNVQVFLTNPSVQDVTVDYATSDIVSAIAGRDYIASSGTITIPAGTTLAYASIPIIGDTDVEESEIFRIDLSNATNVTAIGIPDHYGVIENDDTSVQLSGTTVNVNEGAGFATVTVVRVGDLTRPASVHYRTVDTAGLQNCTLANGDASQRCDYGATVGTIQFPIKEYTRYGETRQTFIVPIVDDALVEGNETFYVSLYSPTGSFLGATTTATITITDNDTAPAAQNPIDGVNMFVTQQYIDFLGRMPDTIGLQNWANTLSNCPNAGFGEADNPTCDRVHVSAGFFLSDEFASRGYFAYKFYEIGFDRRPTYGEFVFDMALVGGAQSPESEGISKTAYTDTFVQRAEFKNRYDALSNSAYVDALETNAEVTLTDKAALVAALNANAKTRAQVLREIVELQSVTDKFFIRAFVAMQYFGYLRREPDTIGYNNWVATLTTDPNNFRHMIFGFIYSDEYRHRFGP